MRLRGGLRFRGVGHSPSLGAGGLIEEPVGQRTVQHDATEVEVPLVQCLHEALGFGQRSTLQCGHDNEGGPLVAKQSAHGLGPFDEALVHRLEKQEELGDVRKKLRAENPVSHLVERTGCQVHEPIPVWGGEHPQEATREELGHALRGFEEVDGVSAGGRVEDDEVVATLRMDLVEALHGDVVVALDEPASDVAVEGVGQDSIAGVGVRRVAAHQVVPRLLGIEHGGPQFAPCSLPQIDLGLAIADVLDAQGISQPTGGIDGEHKNLSALFGCRPGGSRSCHCRLADASRTAEHDNLPGSQQGLQTLRPLCCRAHSPISAASASATWRVARRPWDRMKR